MGKYDDIINLPNPTSKKHPRMSMIDRAAQFAPFAALTGYDDQIHETGRITGSELFLTDDEKTLINEKINYIIDHEIKDPIKIIYFVDDLKKSGGSYMEYQGILKTIDPIERILIFVGGKRIPIDRISAIYSDVIERLFE